MPHYWRIPEPDYNLDWAFKKSTWKKKRRKDSSKEMRNKKQKRKKKRYKANKKKVRGARKKELLQKERKEFPLGRRMYSLRNAPPYRQIVYPKDIERLTHLSPRGARQYLARIRKALNKKPGELLTLKEFCDNSPFERNDVIPYLLD